MGILPHFPAGGGGGAPSGPAGGVLGIDAVELEVPDAPAPSLRPGLIL